MTTRDEGVLPPVLLGLTAVTGLVDAVSYLALGHVFTANMTGNVVFLGFAVAGAPGLSVARSGTAVAAFFMGAVIGGRMAWEMSSLSGSGDCELTARMAWSEAQPELFNLFPFRHELTYTARLRAGQLEMRLSKEEILQIVSARIAA